MKNYYSVTDYRCWGILDALIPLFDGQYNSSKSLFNISLVSLIFFINLFCFCWILASSISLYLARVSYSKISNLSFRSFIYPLSFFHGKRSNAIFKEETTALNSTLCSSKLVSNALRVLAFRLALPDSKALSISCNREINLFNSSTSFIRSFFLELHQLYKILPNVAIAIRPVAHEPIAIQTVLASIPISFLSWRIIAYPDQDGGA